MDGLISPQLTLGVRLNDSATFENYYVPAHSPNSQALAALHEQVKGAGEAFIYLWGEQGVGLTHLLQASCHYADLLKKQVQYLPLQDLVNMEPTALLEGLEQADLVCIDELEAIAGSKRWEHALFDFYNALRDQGKCLLVAARQSPRAIPVELADLRSRLQWGVTYHLQSLNDEEKQAALMHRARALGLELNAEVASFIIQRAPRNMATLFEYLTRLDKASLAEQRKLTVPFVKRVLDLNLTM